MAHTDRLPVVHGTTQQPTAQPHSVSVGLAALGAYEAVLHRGYHNGTGHGFGLKRANQPRKLLRELVAWNAAAAMVTAAMQCLPKISAMQTGSKGQGRWRWWRPWRCT